MQIEMKKFLLLWVEKKFFAALSLEISEESLRGKEKYKNH